MQGNGQEDKQEKYKEALKKMVNEILLNNDENLISKHSNTLIYVME